MPLAMHVALLTAFTMVAFAANSILTRLAVDGGYADPMSFAVLRVLAGALVLAAMVLPRTRRIPWKDPMRAVGAASLAIYMIGFSLAYVTLDAGLGALILFGVVQITMFVHAATRGQNPTPRQIIGASIAFAGLVLVLWPAPDSVSDPIGAAAMVVAGLGWAVYTISGRNAQHPLAATAANFCICLPPLALVLLPFVSFVTPWGIVLALVCGGVTSGLGYALWYRVLPRLQQSVAAVVQLSVPIIAILTGAALLSESVTFVVIAAALLVVFGIGLAVTSRPTPADHKPPPAPR